jgi:Tfp pilus assembly protein PilO
MTNTRKPSQGVLIVLIVVGLLAVAAGGYLFVIGPKRSSASEVQKQIEATQSQIDALRASATAAQVPTPAPVDVSELFRLTKAMPDRADMASVLLELNRIAKDTGITFESISPGSPINASGYYSIPIELIFEGNFYGLSDFLYRLRNLVTVRDGRLLTNGRLFNVKSISFGEGADSFPQIKASLTVNAFVLGQADEEGAPAPAPEAPAEGTTPAEPGTSSTTPGQPTDPAATTPPSATAAPATS